MTQRGRPSKTRLSAPSSRSVDPSRHTLTLDQQRAQDKLNTFLHNRAVPGELVKEHILTGEWRIALLDKMRVSK